jgi:hypothetical protein
VDVRVDHSRHERVACQVVRDRTGRGIVAARYACDARPFDDERDVFADPALSVDEPAGTDDHPLCRKDAAERDAGGHRQRSGSEEDAADASGRSHSAHVFGPAERVRPKVRRGTEQRKVT